MMENNSLLKLLYSSVEDKQWLKELIKPIYLKLHGEIKKGFLRQFFHWLTAGHIVRFLKIRKILNTNQPYQGLQVGGGYHTIPQWINDDLLAGDIYLDASKKLPFPDNCIDYIFTEQFFEHLSYRDGQFFLREAYRVLKPGGVIRQATPSLNGIIDIYQDRNPVVRQEEVVRRHQKHNQDCKNSCHFMNDLFRLWGHQFIYDQETFVKSHQQVGFIDVQIKSFGESSYQPLQQRERHADVDWMKSAFVLIGEARKPD